MSRTTTVGATGAVVGATGAPLLTGAPIVAPGAPAERPPVTHELGNHANIRTSRYELRQQREWYLNREGNMAIVTSADSNPALGIESIQLVLPSDRMKAAGIVCKVSMVSATGSDEGITVWWSRKFAGDITLDVQGREYTPKEDENEAKLRQLAEANGIAYKKKSTRIQDRTLNQVTEAQILSYVKSCLVPINAPAQS